MKDIIKTIICIIVMIIGCNAIINHYTTKIMENNIKYAEWIETKITWNGTTWYNWRCSNCNNVAFELTEYCPYCGAKMRVNNKDKDDNKWDLTV